MMRLLAIAALAGVAGHAIAAPPTAQQRLDQVREELRASEEEAERLSQAAEAARGEAERAAARRRALAARIEAIGTRIAAEEMEARRLDAAIATAEAALAREAAPASALMAGLSALAERPPILTLADSGSLDRFVRLQTLVATTMPLIERRTRSLRNRSGRLRALGEEAARRREAIEGERVRLEQARSRFAALEREQRDTAGRLGASALGADVRVLAAREREGELADAATRHAFGSEIAEALATYPPAPPLPSGRSAAPPEDPEVPPFRYRLPVEGRVTQGLGSLTPDGVRARGLSIAVTAGREVTMPADGEIVFAGPFRGRDGVIVIEHAGGWRSLLTNVRSDREVGAVVGRGRPIGTSLGPVGVELWSGTVPRSPALIARSSG